MPEFVRVKDKASRHEFTIDKINVVDGLEIIDKPAVDPRGNPLPAKPSVPVKSSAPAPKRKRRAAKKTAAKKPVSKLADGKNGPVAANKEESK